MFIVFVQYFKAHDVHCQNIYQKTLFEGFLSVYTL